MRVVQNEQAELFVHVDTFVIGRNLQASWSPKRQKLLSEVVFDVVDIDRTRPGVQDVKGEIWR